MSLKWFGPSVKRAVKNKNKIRIKRAAQYVVEFARGKLGTEGRGEPSPAGGYPYKQTGELRDSIGYEISSDGKSANWGTNEKHGRILETKLNREWMTLTNNDSVVNAMLKRILGGGL